MITRVQGKTLTGDVVIRREPKLTTLEKAMLRWVTVDEEDKILDANVGNGMMAEYLRRNMQCEVCGVSDSMDQVRLARSRLRNCDIVYAPVGDIPWREDAFDTVLMKLGAEETPTLQRLLHEARRVLKPGGQLILGAMCLPIGASKLLPTDLREELCILPKDTLQSLLCELSYQKITWQRTGITTGVMIAWKAKNVFVPE